MIQMRWLKKQVVTTEHLTDPRGTTHLQTVETLQYRTYMRINNGPESMSYWSEWKDVPTEIEDIRGKTL